MKQKKNEVVFIGTMTANSKIVQNSRNFQLKFATSHALFIKITIFESKLPHFWWKGTLIYSKNDALEFKSIKILKLMIFRLKSPISNNNLWNFLLSKSVTNCNQTKLLWKFSSPHVSVYRIRFWNFWKIPNNFSKQIFLIWHVVSSRTLEEHEWDLDLKT